MRDPRELALEQAVRARLAREQSFVGRVENMARGGVADAAQMSGASLGLRGLGEAARYLQDRTNVPVPFLAAASDLASLIDREALAARMTERYNAPQMPADLVMPGGVGRVTGRGAGLAGRTVYHGTSWKNARGILEHGWDPSRGTPHYSYGVYGDRRVINAARDSDAFWFAQDASGYSQARYDVAMPIQISEKARVREIRSSDDLRALARDAGIDTDDLMRDLAWEEAINDEEVARTVEKLRQIVDVLDVRVPETARSATDFTSIPDQVAILNPEVAQFSGRPVPLRRR